MVHLLDIVHEYQLLRCKQEELSIALDRTDRARLVGLRELLRAAKGDRELRRMTRFELPMAVEFTVAGGFGAGRIINVSGGGMSIAAARTPCLGMATIVRVVDPDAGFEYVFPARVVWRLLEGKPSMGIVFDGIPGKSPIGPPATEWHRSVRFGSPPAGPLTA